MDWDTHCWHKLCEGLRYIPAEWRPDLPHEKRLALLAREVQLHELYNCSPKLRHRVRCNGGLGKLWKLVLAKGATATCLTEALPGPVSPCLMQTTEEQEEAAWHKLLADLLQCKPESFHHKSASDCGRVLGKHLQLATRERACPNLRKRIKSEGGLCKLWFGLHAQTHASANHEAESGKPCEDQQAAPSYSERTANPAPGLAFRRSAASQSPHEPFFRGTPDWESFPCIGGDTADTSADDGIKTPEIWPDEYPTRRIDLQEVHDCLQHKLHCIS